MSEAQARRLAAMLTDGQRHDLLILAQVICEMGDTPAVNSEQK